MEIMNKSLATARELLDSSQNWEKFAHQEKINTGSSPTGDEEFDRVGYKIVRNMCDPELLVTPVPDVRGQLNYYSSNDAEFTYSEEELQVPNSLARYTHPFYRKPYDIVKQRVQESIGQSVRKTYYYDRFYFPGQRLDYHADRPSCEISVTIHCSTNLKDVWPICIKSVDGSVTEADLKAGDGLIYKGCERPHWRLPMPGVKRDRIRKLLGMKPYYYHQIFFHYVLANGERSHYAGDQGKFQWG